MKKFLKSIWFPIILFIILEAIFFLIGLSHLKYANCEICPPLPTLCPKCPATNTLAIIGIIPSLIISIITYFIIKKYVK